MLPVPFEQNIPKILKNTLKDSDSGQALIDIMNRFIEDWSKETYELYYLKLPERCPSVFLDEFDYFLNAGGKPFDTERTKRKKIANAVQSHKLRGTWKFDAKLRVDAIAGGDSQIFTPLNSADWILLGAESSDPDVYWGTLGVDGVDDELGIDLIGTFNEVVIPGNIFIDVDNDSLTADQVDNLVTDLDSDVVPAYYRVTLGYIDGSGNFIVYAVIG